MNQTYKKLIDMADGRCELCGNHRNIEVHHIVPRCVGGSEDDSNLIVVCGTCHAKLTPRSELTKAGMRYQRTKPHYVLFGAVERFYQIIHDEELFHWSDILDAFEETVGEKYKEYARLQEEGKI